MKTSVIWIIFGIIVLIIIAFLVSRVGNIAIRQVQQKGTTVTMTASQPMILGVDTVVHWDVPATLGNTNVALKVRTLGGETELGTGRLSDKAMNITLPCDLNYNQASLVLNDERIGDLITWMPITTLPAGRDCVK